MECGQLVRRPRAARLRDQDWEPWRPFIWTRLFGSNSEKVEVDHIVDELCQRGFEVSKAQLEQRLARWSFKSKLNPNTWRYIAKVIRERELSLKKTVVILSGRRVPPEEIKKQTNRHRQVKICPDPVTAPPEDRTALYLCTPRGSSTNLASRSPPLENLPWAQFIKSHWGLILKNIDFLPGARATVRPTVMDGNTPTWPGSLSLLARQEQVTLKQADKIAWLPLTVGSLIRRSLSVIAESEELALEFVSRKSMDCIAARLDFILPETYEDENLQLAEILLNGSPSQIQSEALRILLYLASNHLIMDPRRSLWLDHYLADARLVVGICRLAGISMIHKLVELSQESPTLTAVVNVVFEAAVNSEAADLMCLLLAVGKGVNPNAQIGHMQWKRVGGQYRFLTPLAVAVGRRSVAMIRGLLHYGADIHYAGMHGHSILTFAIINGDPPPSTDIIRTLLAGGASVNEIDTTRISPLQAAFIVGDLGIIEILMDKGADFNHRTALRQDPPIQLHFYSMLDDVGPLELAASYSSRRYSATDINRGSLPAEALDVNHRAQFEYDQEKSLELCCWIWQNRGPHTSFPVNWLKGAMIMAAARGYTRVIAFLHQELPASLEALECTKGLISGLYGAAFGGQVEACRLLLGLGKFSCIHGKQGDIVSKTPGPSPLHHAAYSNYCGLVGLPINHGEEADTEEPSTVCLYKNRESIPWLCHSKHIFNGHFQVSPLRLAILFKNWEVACLLADSGAHATGSDLFAAAEAGHAQLVQRFLSQGIHPNDATGRGTTALQDALSAGNCLLSRLLLAFGAQTDQADLAAIWRIPDISLIQQIMTCRWHRGLRALGRDRNGRSYLENAILSKREDVISFAFSSDTAAYDSGALCAVVYLAARSALPNEDAVLQELLRRRCQPCATVDVDAALENTAISLAAWSGRLDLVTQLLENRQMMLERHPAKFPEIAGNRFKDYSPDYLLLRSTGRVPISYDSNDWHAPRNQDVSPLLFAVCSRKEKIIHTLLDAGYSADVFTIRAAIHQKLTFGLFSKILETSRDSDAAPTSKYPIEIMNDTLLICAIRFGRTEIVEALLSHGANPSTPTQSYEGSRKTAPLTVAIKERQLALVDLLLSHGAEVNKPAWSPQCPTITTAMQVAAASGYIGIVRRLLDRGADVNARRAIGGYTALEAAAANGHLDTVQLLLDAGVNIEHHGRVQYITAICEAERFGYGAVVELLESHGSIQLQDNDVRAEVYGENGSPAFIVPREFPPVELVELVAYWDLDEEPLSGPWQPQKWHQEVALQILKWASVVVSRNPARQEDDMREAATLVAWQATGDWVVGVNIPSFMSDEMIDDDSEDISDEKGYDTSAFWYYMRKGMRKDFEEEERRREPRREPRQRLIAERAARVASDALEKWALDLAAADNASTELSRPSGDGLECTNEDMPDCISQESVWDEPANFNGEQTLSGDTVMLHVEQDDLHHEDESRDLEKLRQESFRRDMAGEEEAPFVPVIWEY